MSQLPQQVQDATAVVDQLLAEAAASAPTVVETPVVEVQPAASSVPATVQLPVEKPEPAPPASVDYSLVMQQMSMMQQQLQNSQNEVNALKQQAQQAATPPPPSLEDQIKFTGNLDLSKDEMDSVGVDNLRVIQKVVEQTVRQMVIPQFKQIHENAEATKKTASVSREEQHANQIIALFSKAKSWFNGNDTTFNQWLLNTDVTGNTYQSILQTHHNALNTPIVINLLRNFESFEQAKLAKTQTAQQSRQQELQNSVVPETSSSPMPIQQDTGILNYSEMVKATEALTQSRLSSTEFAEIKAKFDIAIPLNKVDYTK